MSEEQQRDQLQETLEDTFGLTAFREGQRELVTHMLEGQDVLGIMPTGGGKSLCYQLPAVLMEGITIVISPLISLMKDQVASLLQNGISAAFLNSSLSMWEYESILQEAIDGTYKLIYVAPERLLNERFLDFAKAAQISMITVDEAHCVSQWGHNFRPSYLKIVEFMKRLSKRPVLSAFTATATQQVKTDIMKQLGLQHPFLRVTGFDRKNLYFRVEKPVNKFQATLDYVEEHEDACGVIYCSTRKNVEEVTDKLLKAGIHATRYHAGLSEEERHRNQDDFIYDRANVIVATNAFGMGIDKSNVSYVLHYNMPKNMEAYYQEAGRAGRDGGPAECVLFYSGQDVRMNQFLIEKSELPPEDREGLDAKQIKAMKDKELELLKKMTFYCFTQYCLRQNLLRYFGENGKDYCGNCSNCAAISEEKDRTEEARKILSCILRTKQQYGMSMIIQILRGSKNKRILSNHLDEVSTYGLMSEYSASEIEDMMHHMMVKGYIEQTPGDYSVIRMKKRAMALLKGKAAMSMPIKKSNAKEAMKQAAPLHAIGSVNRPLDQQLFGLLRDLRNTLARKEKVPAYIIFPDTTLKEMARKLPRTQEELRRINGVGKVKMEKYGQQFLELIARQGSSV